MFWSWEFEWLSQGVNWTFLHQRFNSLFHLLSRSRSQDLRPLVILVSRPGWTSESRGGFRHTWWLCAGRILRPETLGNELLLWQQEQLSPLIVIARAAGALPACLLTQLVYKLLKHCSAVCLRQPPSLVLCGDFEGGAHCPQPRAAGEEWRRSRADSCQVLNSDFSITQWPVFTSDTFWLM